MAIPLTLASQVTRTISLLSPPQVIALPLITKVAILTRQMLTKTMLTCFLKRKMKSSNSEEKKRNGKNSWSLSRKNT